MRDATPLPGLTPQHLLSQLAHRVFGPLHPRRTRVVLDYHGLLDHPAGPLIDIAERHGFTSRTVHNQVATIRAAGARQPVPESLAAEATRPSTQDEDHLGRVRIAMTLGLPAPMLAARPTSARADVPPSTHLAAARAGLRVLAAAGPLTLPTIAAAVTRSHRFRSRDHLLHGDFVAALVEVGGTLDADGLWRAPAGVDPPARYMVIVTEAAGRDLTRQEMIEVLIAAGYSKNSATGRMSSSHPLFHRVGSDRYRLISDQAPRSGPNESE
ncbi:MAG: hypothetical protein ABJD68_04235 [Nakamurella sp.]